MRVPILVLTLLVLTACGTEPRRTSALPYAGRDGALVKGLLPGDARDILEHADQFEILSLRPRGYWIENDTTQYLPGLFHGHRTIKAQMLQTLHHILELTHVAGPRRTRKLLA